MIFQSCLSMGPDWYLVCLLPICQHQIPWAWGCALADSFTLDLQQLPCVITLQLSVHNEVLSDSWLGAKADKLKRALLSKLYNTWPRGDEFTDWRLGRNPVFCLCMCLQVSRALLQKCPYPAPVWTPHFVSTFNYTSPVTRHHTSWLLSPQPLSFDFIPTLSCWGTGHPMPLM